MKNISIWSAFFLIGACGNDASSARTPYEPGDITIIGQNLGGAEVPLSECEDECATVDDECGEDAAADVVVNEQGAVADVICFKPNLDVQHIGEEEAPSAEAGNNTVLVFDGLDDGLDVEGDVTISGNNSVVWGEGPDVSSIGGTLLIEKNNAIVRGVRIHGDVAITKNNAQLSFCVIEGDLTITGNNTTLAECTVYGEVKVMGVNTVLAANRFGTTSSIEGKNLTCNNNFLLGNSEEGAGDAGDLGPEIECIESNDDLAPQSDVDLDEGSASAADAG